MQSYGGTQRPPPHKLTPLFPQKCVYGEKVECVYGEVAAVYHRTKHQQIHGNSTKQVSSHRPRDRSQPRHRLEEPCHLSQPCHRLGPCQGDRQRKQQNGPTVDQGGDIRQKKNRSMNQLPQIYDSVFAVATSNSEYKSSRRRQQRATNRQQLR